jgi:hypothetical protein
MATLTGFREFPEIRATRMTESLFSPVILIGVPIATAKQRKPPGWAHADVEDSAFRKRTRRHYLEGERTD